MFAAETEAIVSTTAAGIVSVAAAVGVWMVRGSTAVPAAGWALVAGLALTAEMGWRAFGGLSDPAAASAARLVTSALAVCPTMALLGAKRPQHGVWQWIVASLALVLAMPALTATLVRPGTLPDVLLLGRGFLALLLLVGWLNFAATGRGVAAALVTVGEGLLMRGFLPFGTVTAGAPSRLEGAATVLVALGAMVAVVQTLAARFRATAERATAELAIAERIERPYRALRETFGAAWTLRIAERFNVLADERGWPCRLHFAGIDVGGDPADTAWHRDARRAFAALARRFVSAEWMARHGWGGPG
jgi:hypothetical protein